MTYQARIDSAVTFDTGAIIEFMGGVSATHAALTAMKCIVDKRTVQKWRERNNMPAPAIASLMAYQAGQNMPFPIYDFIKAQ